MNKSEKKWEDIALDEEIYQGENEDDGHTKQGLIDICNGVEATAKMMFYLLEWQSPYTMLADWNIEGEIDDDFNLIKQ